MTFSDASPSRRPLLVSTDVSCCAGKQLSTPALLLEDRACQEAALVLGVIDQRNESHPALGSDQAAASSLAEISWRKGAGNAYGR